MKNINFTVNNNLCTGCGICEDVCPKKCIFVRLQKGEYRPMVDESSCLGVKCSKCLKVCPGKGIDLNALSEKLFDDKIIKRNKYIGRYVGLHTGYSLDEKIRFHSASGGMVSQFLIYLLEKRYIDGAVVTGFGEDHLTPVSYIARTREDVIAARSSKYCPVALNKVGNEINNSEGKFVVVGLPCHIQGFRKRMDLDKKLKDRIIGLFSIYCSSERTFLSQDYLLKHFKIIRDNVTYFSYRDNGCLGELTIDAKYNKVKIPYTQYYVPLLRSFFKPHRCLTCIDHYGELADVCFGDIHIPPYSDDHIGISSWITRTSYWESLFKQAENEGYIKMDDINEETLNRSQATMLYPKQRKAKAVMNMDKVLGKVSPKYDVDLDTPGIKDYISQIVCHTQRFIGRRKSLWFIVDLLARRH